MKVKIIFVCIGFTFLSLRTNGEGPLKDFPCEVAPKAKERYSHLVGNAGCIVIEKAKLLVVENLLMKKLLTPPSGHSEPGESAQCTAARETFEESGAKVIVQELLHNFEDKFYLFRCELKDKQLANLHDLPVPPAYKDEISRAYWLDLRLSSEKAWRFPKQFYVINGIFLSAVSQ